MGRVDVSARAGDRAVTAADGGPVGADGGGSGPPPARLGPVVPGPLGGAMKVSASGAATVRTTKLLTPEQVDEAIGRQLSYSAPGAG